MAPTATGPVVISSTGSVAPLHGSSEQGIGDFRGIDHVLWYVGNAKQAASYYMTRMGFHHIAYRGLETRSRHLASHVVGNGKVRFVFTSPVRGMEDEKIPEEDRKKLKEIYEHLELHGDAVKGVSFEVDNLRAVYEKAVENGAVSKMEPTVFKDENGEVLVATIGTYGDTTHVLVERSNYSGPFLPGYKTSTVVDPLAALLPTVELEAIDHCVGNQDWGQMEAVCE